MYRMAHRDSKNPAGRRGPATQGKNIFRMSGRGVARCTGPTQAEPLDAIIVVTFLALASEVLPRLEINCSAATLNGPGEGYLPFLRLKIRSKPVCL